MKHKNPWDTIPYCELKSIQTTIVYNLNDAKQSDLLQVASL